MTIWKRVTELQRGDIIRGLVDPYNYAEFLHVIRETPETLVLALFCKRTRLSRGKEVLARVDNRVRRVTSLRVYKFTKVGVCGDGR